MVFVSDNWILFLTDWVVFYLVRTGFDCFFEKNDEFRDFGVSGYFCFLPWCMLGVLVFLWLLGAGDCWAFWLGAIGVVVVALVLGRWLG